MRLCILGDIARGASDMTKALTIESTKSKMIFQQTAQLQLHRPLEINAMLFIRQLAAEYLLSCHRLHNVLSFAKSTSRNKQCSSVELTVNLMVAAHCDRTATRARHTAWLLAPQNHTKLTQLRDIACLRARCSEYRLHSLDLFGYLLIRGQEFF